MFYAGLNEESAVLETYDPELEYEPREIAIARFHSVRPLRMLDLTRLPGMPSQFVQTEGSATASHLRECSSTTSIAP